MLGSEQTALVFAVQRVRRFLLLVLPIFWLELEMILEGTPHELECVCVLERVLVLMPHELECAYELERVLALMPHELERVWVLETMER